jgi:hypothetical protein
MAISIGEIEKYYIIKKDGSVLKKSKNAYHGFTRMMTHNICKKGYHRVHLTIDGTRKCLSVHRLVATKYVKGETKRRCEVNHIDGDKHNNCHSNLEWCTHKENMDHARHKLKRKMGRVENKVRNDMIYCLSKEFSNKDIAALLSTTSENITRIKNNYRNKLP